MSGKKSLGLLVAFLVLATATTAGWFFYHAQLQGIGPAIQPPAADIAQLIDKRETPLQLPDGFSIEVFAKDLGAPRVMITDPNGVLLVSIPTRGQVVALPDKNKDNKADTPIILTKGLNKPHGLALKCAANNCQLFIAETNAIAVYDYDSTTPALTNRKKLVDLPSGGNHTSRSLLLLPPPHDTTLLVAIGSTCNVCHEQNSQRAKILALDTTTGALKDFATGLRNSVFQTINPWTGEIWATEMGRDLLGDDIPPDEINIIEEGKNYGWPNCYGQNIHDTQFDKNTYIRNPCMEPFESPAHIDIPAHSAPLGLAFVAGDGWPKEYAKNLLVAYHGSWNRSVPTGYKIARFKPDANGEYKNAEDFISGWLTSKNTANGRPVDLLMKPDGQLFISDDKAGVIYRVYPTK